MNDTRLTKDALYVPSIVFESGTLSSSSEGKVTWNGEELGGSTLDASGDITFTGLDTFTQYVTFNGGMICNSDIVLNGARLLLANGAAVEIYQGTDIPLPEGGGTGSITPGTGNSGESIDTSNFAKLNADNTFTGNNNFTGNLTLDGKLLLNGKEIDSVVSGHNVGEQWISMDGIIPMGGLPFLGQTVSKETYSDLYNWAESNGRFKTEAEWQSLYSANNSNVSFYAKVDDNTFRLPSFKGYLKANETAGGYTKEGLPDITGHMSMGGVANASYATGISNTAGAITGCNAMDISSTTTPSGIYANAGFNFSASKSNSIYGNSTHVTPETNTILVGVYAFNTIINPSNLDVESLRHDITSNAESLRHDITSNVESLRDDITSNVESLNRDISSKKGYVDFTTGVYAYGSITGYLGDSQNIKYFTAPYDCFIVLQLKFKNTLASYDAPGIWVSVNDVNIAYPMITDVTGYTAVIPLYLKSGDKLGVDARYNSGTFTKLSSLCYYKWN